MAIDGVEVPEDGAPPVDHVGELLRRVAQGDQKAFGRLYDMLSPRAFGLILRVLVDRPQSEEVLQDVFLEVWQSADHFAPNTDHGRPWVLTIAHRRAADRVRSTQGEKAVATDAATAAALADTAPFTAPPLTLRSTLLSKIATTPQGEAALAEPQPADLAEPEPEPYRDPSPTTTTIQAISRRNWTRGLFGLAASLILLVGIGVGAVSLNETLNRSDAVIALDQIKDAPDGQSGTIEVADGGTATAHWSESLGKVVLVSNGLPEVTPEKTFEMWLLRDDGTAVSGGTFAAGTVGSTTELLDGAFEPGDTITVTVEQAGGSTTGAPTTEPIVIIPTP